MFEYLAFTCFLLILINWFLLKPFYFKRKGIPYNLPWPIFGNALGEFLDSYHAYWYKKYQLVKKKGGVMGYHMFSKPTLILTDPDIVRAVMIENYEYFNSHGIHSNPEDPFGRNLFHIAGDEWKKIRTKLTPFFSLSKLKVMTQLMSSNMKEFISKFDEGANLKKSINVNDLSLKLSTDVIVNTIFGIKPDSFTNSKSFFFHLQEKLINHVFIMKTFLGYLSPTLYNYLGLLSFPTKVTRKLTGFIDEVIDQRSKGIGVRQDFIQGMYELIKHDPSLSQDYENNNKGFSSVDATAQGMVMYTAGTETTGNSLSYLLYELAVHQDIQDKVRNEIKNALATTDDGIFSYDLLSQLTYTKMVINENLRKYPIVPIIMRSCIKAIKVRGIDIEPGTGISIPSLGFHRDPEYYPEPEKFIPERFASENKTDSLYLPFGLGPRTCIGMKMAMVEIAYALSEVLNKFKLLPCDKTGSKIEFNWKPTLNPAGGLWLDVERL